MTADLHRRNSWTRRKNRKKGVVKIFPTKNQFQIMKIKIDGKLIELKDYSHGLPMSEEKLKFFVTDITKDCKNNFDKDGFAQTTSTIGNTIIMVQFFNFKLYQI